MKETRNLGRDLSCGKKMIISVLAKYLNPGKSRIAAEGHVPAEAGV